MLSKKQRNEYALRVINCSWLKVAPAINNDYMD